MKRTLLIFFIFLLLGITAFSQDIKGFVINKNNRKPVPECLVIVKGTTQASVTNENGAFEFILRNKQQNPTLVLTMLGYATVEYELNNYKKDTFYITPKDVLLKEVVVSANKKNTLNPGNVESILDFDLLSDELVILTAGAAKNNLRLIDETGKVLYNLKVDSRSETLKHDCIGNLHLLSPDSTWQVFNDYTKLNTLEPHSLSVFKQVLGNCVCVNNKNYYFQTAAYRSLRTNYFYYNEEAKGQRQELVAFQDTAKIKSFEQDYNLQYFLDVRRKSNYSMYNEPVDSIKLKMEHYREALPLDWTYNSWLGKVETQMIKVDTSTFIINFTDTVVYAVSKNNKVNAIAKMNVLKTKKLLPKVYIDADYKETYLTAFGDSKLTLIRFDIQSGTELSRTDIPGVPFLPAKIIIDSGKAYFIQKNLADEQSYKIIKYYLN